MKLNVTDLKMAIYHMGIEKVEQCTVKIEGHLLNLYFVNSKGEQCVVHLQHADSDLPAEMTKKTILTNETTKSIMPV